MRSQHASATTYGLRVLVWVLLFTLVWSAVGAAVAGPAAADGPLTQEEASDLCEEEGIPDGTRSQGTAHQNCIDEKLEAFGDADEPSSAPATEPRTQEEADAICEEAGAGSRACASAQSSAAQSTGEAADEQLDDQRVDHVEVPPSDLESELGEDYAPAAPDVGGDPRNQRQADIAAEEAAAAAAAGEPARRYSPGADGCYSPWRYHPEALPLAQKYGTPGCERNLLPAWRWRTGAMDLQTNLSILTPISNGLHVLVSTLFVFSGVLWSILLTVLEWGLTTELALRAHSLINNIYLTFSQSILSSSLIPIVVILLTVGIARSALRSDTRRVVTSVLLAALFLGGIQALADRAATSPEGEGDSRCAALPPGDRELCEQSSVISGAPPTGSPGWFAWRGVDLVDTITHELVEPFTSDSNLLSFNGAFYENRSDTSCARYAQGLYDRHAHFTGISDDEMLASLHDTRSSEGMLRLASRLWEAGYLTYWKMAQFGLSNEAGENASCFLLEANSRIAPEEQAVLAAYAFGLWEEGVSTADSNDVPAAEVFNVDTSDSSDTAQRLFAWSACEATISGIQITSWSTSPDWGHGDLDCADWWSGSGPPTDVSLNRITSRTAAQAQESGTAGLLELASAWEGDNTSERLFAGTFSFIVAVIYLWTFGALAVGSLIAQIGIIVMMMLLPVTLLLLAVPSSKRSEVPLSERRGMRMLRLTGAMFVAKAMLTIVLAATIVLTGIIQSIFLDGLADPVATTTAFSTALPYAFTGRSIMRALLVAMSPLISLYIIRKLGKSIGLNSITSLSGALTFPMAAAARTAGDTQSADRIQDTGKRWARRGATIAAGTAAAGALAGYGVASTPAGKRTLGGAVTNMRTKASDLHHALNDETGKLRGFRESLSSIGQVSAMFGKGRVRRAGVGILAADKAVGPGGLLDTIGISHNTLGERVPLDDGIIRRSVAANDLDRETGDATRQAGRKFRERYAKADNPEKLMEAFDSTVQADARGRTGSDVPAFSTPEERDQVKARAAAAYGIDGDALDHLHVGPGNKPVFDPHYDWEANGYHRVAELASVRIARSDTDAGKALRAQWDAEDPNQLQTYVEMSDLVTHAAGGSAKHNGVLQVRRATGSSQPLDLHRVDDQILRDITAYVNTNASERLQHEAVYIQSLRAGLTRVAQDLSKQYTPDGDFLPAERARQHSQQVTREIEDALSAASRVPANRTQSIMEPRLQHNIAATLSTTLDNMAEAQAAALHATLVPQVANGTDDAAVQHAIKAFEQQQQQMRNSYERQLQEAAQAFADGRRSAAELSLRQLGAALERQATKTGADAVADVDGLRQFIADVADREAQMEHHYPQSSSKPPVYHPTTLRSAQLSVSRVLKTLDAVDVPAMPSSSTDTGRPDGWTSSRSGVYIPV